jgi:hypothetical protein
MSRVRLSLDGKLDDCDRVRYDEVGQARLANQRACDEDGPLKHI